METTHATLIGPPIARAPLSPPEAAERPPAQPSAGRIATAVVTAFTMQLAAVFTAYVAAGIALLAAFSTWATDEPTPWWGAFSAAFALAAIGLYVCSGYVATRIARSRWAWLTLLLIPVAAFATTAVFALV